MCACVHACVHACVRASVRLCVCMSVGFLFVCVCLLACLSVRLSVCPSVCLSVCLSVSDCICVYIDSKCLCGATVVCVVTQHRIVGCNHVQHGVFDSIQVLSARDRTRTRHALGGQKSLREYIILHTATATAASSANPLTLPQIAPLPIPAAVCLHHHPTPLTTTPTLHPPRCPRPFPFTLSCQVLQIEGRFSLALVVYEDCVSAVLDNVTPCKTTTFLPYWTI